jgi:conjugal transfer pilus assembly protein TraE
MDISQRNASIAGLQRTVRLVISANLGLAAATLILAAILFSQSKIVILQTPGMPASTEIRRTAIDIGAQRAMLAAVTSNLVQVNPSNVEYQKSFLQAFLSPAMYTRLSAEIDAKARLLADQRELGSYYFVFRAHEYDPRINRHFVMGEVHTVNAAKDTAEPYVFEYALHIDNYRPMLDDITSYRGDKPHNAAWLETQKR